MANPLLAQILGSVFGGASRGRGAGGPFGGGMGPNTGMGGGGLGDLLGGMMGRGGATGGAGLGRAGASPFGGRGALLAMLLPFAMQWVQRNGGLGEVLKRFQRKGYGGQANSWIASGPNELLDTDAVDDVVGTDELSRMAHELGVPEREVADGFAEIFPEMIDQLSPEGRMPADADDVLQAGQSQVERELSQLTVNSGI